MYVFIYLCIICSFYFIEFNLISFFGYLCALFMYSTVALVRDAEKVTNSDTGKLMYGQYFEGAEVGALLFVLSFYAY